MRAAKRRRFASTSGKLACKLVSPSPIPIFLIAGHAKSHMQGVWPQVEHSPRRHAASKASSMA